MTSERKWKIAGAVILFFAAVAYFVLAHEMSTAEKLSAPSVYSGGSTGASAFMEFSRRLNKPQNGVAVLQDAYLEKTDLTGISTLMILSPVAELSKRESEILKKFVESGGTLIATFHSAQTWLHGLNELKSALGAKQTTERAKNFENGKTETIVAGADVWPFVKDEKYTFYSSLRFTGKECLESPIKCYVQSFDLKKGRVIFIAGIPPFSNALIGKNNNINAASRVLNNGARVAVDEYHHFFSSKTVWDLLTYPPFILPIAGMVVGLMAYFLFAQTRFSEETLRAADKITAPSYHALGEKILENFIGQPGVTVEAYKKQAEYLARLFPEKREDLDTVLNQMNRQGLKPVDRIYSLLRFHQSVLRQKGRTQ